MTSPRFFIILIVVLWTGESRAYAQSGEMEAHEARMAPPTLPHDSLQLLGSAQPLPNWYDCVGNLPHDIGSLAVLSVDRRTLPTIVGLTGLTMGLVASDHETYVVTGGFYERSKTVASVSDFFVSLGDGKVPLVLAGTFGLYGFAASDHRSLRVASQTLEALLVTGLVVQTLKHITGRESPSEATSETGTWRPFPSFKAYRHHQSRYHAFPSGHIATTMATVTVLIENFPEHHWLKPVGYSVVGLVGIGLVGNGWHWYSDLPLGIALGYAFGKIVSHPDGEAEAADPDNMDLSFSPVANEFGSGVRVSLRF